MDVHSHCTALFNLRQQALRKALENKHSLRLGTGSEQKSGQSQVQQVPEEEDGLGQHCNLTSPSCNVEVPKEELKQQVEVSKEPLEQPAEADTGKSNLYTTAAAVLQTAPQLSYTKLQVDLNEQVSHNTQTTLKPHSV